MTSPQVGAALEPPHDDQPQSPLIVVSNRGPVSFRMSRSGERVPKRAAGGLVATLSPALPDFGAAWISAHVLDGLEDAPPPALVDGVHIHHLGIDGATNRRYYDVVANGTLWFVHHDLFDAARRPLFDRHWWEAWESYRSVNHMFAKEIANLAPQGATVLVQDYHLVLVGRWLRENRPDLRTVHFHHTPFAGAESIRILPDMARHEMIDSLCHFDACGFHAHRWANNFIAAAHEVVGITPKTFVSAAGAGVDELERTASSDACATARDKLTELANGRKLIVRVDRIELSKNLVRGFLAFEDLLTRYPQWKGRVTFAAFAYPTRERLADYLSYRNEIEAIVRRINQTFATEDWNPIYLHLEDDFPSSVAALQSYDVLLVNPTRDGLNLVAKEGPILNQNNGLLVLSREAGVMEELASVAIGVNPFDIVATAEALRTALETDDETRVLRSAQLRAASVEQTPHSWLADQLKAANAAR